MTETHSSTNQRATEPVPPSPAHAEPSAPERDAPSSGALPREAGAMPAIAREGLADGETDNVVPPTGTLA